MQPLLLSCRAMLASHLANLPFCLLQLLTEHSANVLHHIMHLPLQVYAFLLEVLPGLAAKQSLLQSRLQPHLLLHFISEGRQQTHGK